MTLTFSGFAFSSNSKQKLNSSLTHAVFPPATFPSVLCVANLVSELLLL